MAAFADYAEQAYLDRLCQAFAEQAEPDESPGALRSKCEHLLRRARALGFESEFEVSSFVLCGLVEGPQFDAAPPYRGILESVEMSARSKAEMMLLILEHSGSAEDIDDGAEA
jgi:hypothetical protein